MKKILVQLAGNRVKLLLLTTFIAGGCNTTRPTRTQETTTKAYNMSTSDWVFTANTAIPNTGSSRQITGGYNVTLSSKRMIVYLPYFGRAYAGADIYSLNSPLDFTSSSFTSSARTKSHALYITITPGDYKEVQSMDFTFYENGTAYLNVNLLNRSSISFNGYVEQIKS